MCLDQIGEHDQAFAYFDRANQMDPNSYFNDAYMGWHYIQTGDYAAARVWLMRSHQMEWQDNVLADSNLQIAQDRMLESATNTSLLQGRFGAPHAEIPAWK
jgi:Tfp pilus assembly protein PilF